MFGMNMIPSIAVEYKLFTPRDEINVINMAKIRYTSLKHSILLHYKAILK